MQYAFLLFFACWPRIVTCSFGDLLGLEIQSSSSKLKYVGRANLAHPSLNQGIYPFSISMSFVASMLAHQISPPLNVYLTEDTCPAAELEPFYRLQLNFRVLIFSELDLNFKNLIFFPAASKL